MSDPDLPTVAVVGPGAIGTTIAAALHQRGVTPLLVGRTPRPGLQLHTDDGSVVVPGPVRTDPATVAAPVDVVFLAVKATQTADAARWLRVLCAPETVVCVLQNGIEQEAAVGPLVPGSTVVPAVVWFPAVRRTDGSVRLLADARLTLPDVPATSVVQHLLRGTPCTVEVAEDFRSTAWRKLLQNAAAGLMVLTGRRSGVFRRDDLGGLALAYLREALAVARADGADLDDDVPQQVLGRFRTAPADQGTSILTDREAGQPLEWDVRNGVVRRRGSALGVPTPISDVIVPLLAAASDDVADSLSVSVTTTASVAALWSALTAERAGWWPDLVLDPVVGSTVRETWTEDGRERSAEGHVTEVAAPTRLAFVWRQPTWPTSLEVRIDLRRAGDRSIVTLTEQGFAGLPDGAAVRAGHEAGWPHHLANLLAAAGR